MERPAHCDGTRSIERGWRVSEPTAGEQPKQRVRKCHVCGQPATSYATMPNGKRRMMCAKCAGVAANPEDRGRNS